MHGVDQEVFEDSIRTIRETGPDISFVYFCGVDEAGHKHGSLESPYFDAVERIDSYLKELHKAVIARDEEWLLIVVTDHGHRDEGGHGGDSAQERASFVIAHGVNREHPNWPVNMQPHELAGLILELVN